MLATYARAQYAEMQVQTTPGKLVIMLYDGALRFLRQGLDALTRSDLSEQSRCLSRAQEILLHLDATLNPDAGRISRDLRSTYRYCVQRLLVANAEDRQENVEEVIELLESLREAWTHAERSVRTELADVEPALAGALR